MWVKERRTAEATRDHPFYERVRNGRRQTRNDGGSYTEDDELEGRRGVEEESKAIARRK